MARPRREFPPSEHERILARWREGHSATAIGHEFRVARPTLVRILREAGIKVESRWWAHHGAANHRWRGGRVRLDGGYIAVHVARESPFAVMGQMRHKDRQSSAVYVPEHRLVMAESLGRPLGRWETVHHINGVKDDNRLENLQLRTGNHGKGIVVVCFDCGSTNVGSRPLH